MGTIKSRMKFIFYFEYRSSVGGVTSLYITLFEELIKQKIDFLFFNYHDGIVVQELSKKGHIIPVIDISEFDWMKLSDHVTGEDIIILTSFDECYYKFVEINPKILYYNINDYLGEISKYKWGLNMRFLGRKFIQKLDESNSILLMDDTGINNAKSKFDYKLKNLNFLPVPITESNVNNYFKRSASSMELRLSYVGRSIDWKMMPLKKILNDLKLIIDKPKIRFTIIVDNKEEMKKYIDLPNFENDGFYIEIYENVPPFELPELLLENSDIGFGMGTVVLDYGKLGIPVILMDACRKELPNHYKYRWNFETEMFCLGKFIDSYLGNFTGLSMKQLIDQAHNNPEFLNANSTKVFEYTNSQHGVKNFVNKLNTYAKKTEFKMAESKPFVLYYNKIHQFFKNITLKVTQ